MSECVVETEGIVKSFGEILAVSDLSLQIRRGEVFGFLGPNGAGKTTSIKMLLGLIVPTGGRGTVLGAPLGDRAARARMGFLPEHFRFHDALSAREFLRFHGRLSGLRGADLERRIDTMIERVALQEAQHRPLRHFSKGMLQRAGLAQALLAEPDLVFLDEPTSALDPLGRLLVRGLIEDTRRRGATVILNSHLLSEVEATCDRVIFVKQGRTVEELSLQDQEVDLDVELKLDRTDAATLEGLESFGHDVHVEEGTVRVRVGTEAMIPQIARWLVAQGVGIYAVRGRRQSLEQRFVEVMGEDQRPG